MMRDVLYCNECGARLNLYVVGVCSRCNFDLTGEDEDRREERWEAPPLRPTSNFSRSHASYVGGLRFSPSGTRPPLRWAGIVS